MPVAPADAIVVIGTSRGDGNTHRAVYQVLHGRDVSVVDLAETAVGVYDYTHANSGDDFLALAEVLVGKSLWLLATPVYWYTMSAQMKILMDRLSDLVTIRKDLGRRLRGISVAIVATGAEAALPEGFESPFRLTCAYFEMRYLGACYLQFGADDAAAPAMVERAQAFGSVLFS